MPEEPMPSVAVRRINVHHLFGRYTYLIEVRDNSNLLILYGDNGSGKTTILRLLFHLLSTGRRRNHLQSIGQIPFSKFEVQFNNGLTVFAARDKSGTGNFRYGVKDYQDTLVATNILFDEDGDLIETASNDSDLDQILPLIKSSMGADLYYIGDDRSVESDRLPSHRSELDVPYSRSQVYADTIGAFRRRVRSVRASDQRNEDLVVALATATEWARNQVIGATSIGTANTSSIYTDVINRIVMPQVVLGEKQTSPHSILQKIRDLEERDKQYEPFGLASGFAGKELANAFATANPDSQQVIMDILQPYLESIEARLEALSSLHSTLSTFAFWMNQLLKDKTITLRLPRGIEIFTDTGEALSPEFLSSGEQHLLLLLASTLYAQERPSLFVIDEPELSLNMKWQRQLLDILTECTSGGSTQFVLATHSFEILAGHENQVVQLSDMGSYESALPF